MKASTWTEMRTGIQLDWTNEELIQLCKLLDKYWESRWEDDDTQFWYLNREMGTSMKLEPWEVDDLFELMHETMDLEDLDWDDDPMVDFLVNTIHHLHSLGTDRLRDQYRFNGSDYVYVVGWSEIARKTLEELWEKHELQWEFDFGYTRGHTRETFKLKRYTLWVPRDGSEDFLLYKDGEDREPLKSGTLDECMKAWKEDRAE